MLKLRKDALENIARYLKHQREIAAHYQDAMSFECLSVTERVIKEVFDLESRDLIYSKIESGPYCLIKD